MKKAYNIKIQNNLQRINITDIATQEEHTDFRGNHYVEAYIIKDGICIAKERIEVPIREMIEN